MGASKEGPSINDVIIREGREGLKISFLMTLGAKKGQTGRKGEGSGYAQFLMNVVNERSPRCLPSSSSIVNLQY